MRRLGGAAAVVERLQAAGQLGAGLDQLELGAGDVVAPVELRAERPRAVPAHEEIHVADVVGLHDHDRLRRQSLDALPDLCGARGRRERVQEDADAARLHTERGDLGIPVVALLPVGVGLSPQPQPGGHVAHLDRHGRRG